MKGPRNAAAGRQRAGSPERIRDWRKPPECEQVARREDVWYLLAWYHHEVVRPELGLRGFLRRLWRRIKGEKIKLLSPWEQLSIRDEWEARRAELAEQEAMRAALEQDLDGHRN